MSPTAVKQNKLSDRRRLISERAILRAAFPSLGAEFQKNGAGTGPLAVDAKGTEGYNLTHELLREANE